MLYVVCNLLAPSFSIFSFVMMIIMIMITWAGQIVRLSVHSFGHIIHFVTHNQLWHFSFFFFGGVSMVKYGVYTHFVFKMRPILTHHQSSQKSWRSLLIFTLYFTMNNMMIMIMVHRKIAEDKKGYMQLSLL